MDGWTDEWMVDGWMDGLDGWIAEKLLGGGMGEGVEVLTARASPEFLS